MRLRLLVGRTFAPAAAAAAASGPLKCAEAAAAAAVAAAAVAAAAAAAAATAAAAASLGPRAGDSTARRAIKEKVILCRFSALVNHSTIAAVNKLQPGY